MTACLAQTDGFSRYASCLDDASHQPMPSAHQKAPDGLLVTRQEVWINSARERRGSSRQELSRSNAALTFASSSASGADPSRSKASAALLRAAAACASRHGPPFSCLNLLYASA